jgi:hypothetical protein
MSSKKKSVWVHKFPNVPGQYWFAGERYSRSEFAKKEGEKPRYEMILCSVHTISNGVLVAGDGQFVFESELGDEWFFAPATVPDMPEFSGK